MSSSALDPGIAGAVELLRAKGIATFESCEGGRGHSSPEPFIRFSGSVAEAMHAVAAILFDPSYGLRPMLLRQEWTLMDGWPVGPEWRLTFYPPDNAKWPWVWPGREGWEPAYSDAQAAIDAEADSPTREANGLKSA